MDELVPKIKVIDSQNAAVTRSGQAHDDENEQPTGEGRWVSVEA